MLAPSVPATAASRLSGRRQPAGQRADLEDDGQRARHRRWAAGQEDWRGIDAGAGRGLGRRRSTQGRLPSSTAAAARMAMTVWIRGRTWVDAVRRLALGSTFTDAA